MPFSERPKPPPKPRTPSPEPVEYKPVTRASAEKQALDIVRVVEYIQKGAKTLLLNTKAHISLSSGPAGQPPTWIHRLPTHRPIVKGRPVVIDVTCRAVPPAKVFVSFTRL